PITISRRQIVMLNKLFPGLAIATVIALPITALTPQTSTAQINLIFGNGGQNNNSGNSVSSDNKTLLMQAGLQPADCVAGANIIIVYMPNGKQACAFATGVYPAGQAYRMNPNDFSLNPVGGRANAANNQFQQPQQPVYVQQPQQPVYAQQPQQPYPTQMQTVMVTYNPNQPVPPPASARISAALASQGLQPAACGAGVVVFNVNNTYTACAYPTANFPAGNYRLDIPGL
ncbi:MAG TPA: hypothetical protein VIQ31_02935, partial [Phormidium sp.]